MKNWIDAHFDAHLSLLKKLAAIPAPSRKEERRAAFLLDWCSENGFHAYSDEAKNVIIPFFEEGEGDLTVYAAHTDVVFPDETELPVREEGGRLYAPGVGDDTANAAAILTTLLYLKETGKKPRTPTLFVLNSCEEGLGNLAGTRKLFGTFAGRISEFVSFDCNFSEGMIVGAVGSERWRAVCRTEGGHSFNDFGKPNAIHRAAELVTKLYAQPVPERPGSRTTYNVGGITGGTTINTVAPSCELLYEYRSNDRECLSVMRGQFEKLLAEADRPEARFTAELIGERPCSGEVDPARHKALLDRCEAVLKAVLGTEIPRCFASTDANIPLSLGIPAVTIGLFEGAGEHTRGEWLDIASLKPGLEIAIRLVTGAEA